MTTPPHRLAGALAGALLLDTEPYPSCDACFEQIDVFVERLLSDPSHEDAALSVHLARCGTCAEEADALAGLLTGQS